MFKHCQIKGRTFSESLVTVTPLRTNALNPKYKAQFEKKKKKKRKKILQLCLRSLHTDVSTVYKLIYTSSSIQHVSKATVVWVLINLYVLGVDAESVWGHSFNFYVLDSFWLQLLRHARLCLSLVFTEYAICNLPWVLLSMIKEKHRHSPKAKNGKCIQKRKRKEKKKRHDISVLWPSSGATPNGS